MKKIKRSIPIIPADLETLPFQQAMDDQYISNCKIAQETIEYQTDEALHFDKVVFENVNFLEAAWPRSEFVDAVFINCDLSNADFSRSVFHRTEFRNSKLLGTNFAEAGVRHTLFIDCVLNYATFGFSLCNTTQFESSEMHYADFYEAELKSTEFLSCGMNNINFIETGLKGVDLSTNRFENIQVTVEKLAGCRVSSEQALAFARQLGLVIAD
ncbi:pentapeptide repeat-containing protein [Planomicrobium sp. CPCC 101110]|uniref:pentapeptide repeat-containing protein n=1 Tax=Planomicrobium sp. CPCC 101110 TaxID=2599619 RepID=UPI0011B3A9C6|nr:pentapeptide repeat-containing protein [Planomicrobium sp. CPCC 101110]TWT27378.1 pentapeptide repeat-containing protein [Planomicrobium sp. CPCC 101110]